MRSGADSALSSSLGCHHERRRRGVRLQDMKSGNEKIRCPESLGAS